MDPQSAQLLATAIPVVATLVGVVLGVIATFGVEDARRRNEERNRWAVDRRSLSARLLEAEYMLIRVADALDQVRGMHVRGLITTEELEEQEGYWFPIEEATGRKRRRSVDIKTRFASAEEQVRASLEELSLVVSRLVQPHLDELQAATEMVTDAAHRWFPYETPDIDDPNWLEEHTASFAAWTDEIRERNADLKPAVERLRRARSAFAKAAHDDLAGTSG